MVSKASDDLPDPLNPVITVSVLRGISTSMFFRLCCRAPCTVMRSSMMDGWSEDAPTLYSTRGARALRNPSARTGRSGLAQPQVRLATIEDAAHLPLFPGEDGSLVVPSETRQFEWPAVQLLEFLERGADAYALRRFPPAH